MAEYIKRTDVMKICEGYSEHCFNSNDANGQDIADRILDDVVELPTADVVEVVRCVDCKHCKAINDGLGNASLYCDLTFAKPDVDATDYCSCGERRTDNGN